ncbi:acyl-CoA thioesterase [Oceanicola sp. D3]|uniref:acyl-CoA thioesterase n=1 Tax=Oceanicola sp. D3 TaxID=2587163 RepID=UPI0011223979|nr:acyl-CoA thioesterase [Oceanicola sp. D3]QDC11244.1 acyl-CoA thioesterase [Oceanicola sp. D3]
MSLFTLDVDISFGHCDAAGIVYYPNYFRWFDRCFHTFLKAQHGGHAALCRQLGARGLGLISADARFRSPGFDGDVLRLEMSAGEWGRKSLRLDYSGTVGERLVIEGEEVRGVFIEDGGRIRAGDVAPLREVIGG